MPGFLSFAGHGEFEESNKSPGDHGDDRFYPKTLHLNLGNSSEESFKPELLRTSTGGGGVEDNLP